MDPIKIFHLYEIHLANDLTFLLLSINLDDGKDGVKDMTNLI